MVFPRTMGILAGLAALAIAAGCGPPPKRYHRQALQQYATGADATSAGSTGTDYSPQQATGAPNVSTCSDNPLSWSPISAQPGTTGDDDALTLTYDRYVFVSDVKISETYNPGVITLVTLQATDGTAPDAIIFDNVAGDGVAGCPTIFHIAINGGTTADQYNRVVIAFDEDLIGDTNGVNGPADDYNEIDAVEVDGDELVSN